MKTVAAVAVAATLLLLTNCGVPAQQAPVQIKPEAVPSQLRDVPSPESAMPSTADPGKSTVFVHFVRKDRLVGLPREAPAASQSGRLNAVVTALIAGPSEGEQARGITSALPPGLQLTVVAIEGQRVVLELSGETDGRSATENVLAVGQIVLSMTSLTTVKEVVFSRDGAPAEALLADGALATKPLTAADYAVLKGS
jgi:spore germination protein GerM